jgi:hypothetical protein
MSGTRCLALGRISILLQRRERAIASSWILGESWKGKATFNLTVSLEITEIRTRSAKGALGSVARESAKCKGGVDALPRAISLVLVSRFL